MIQSDHSCAFDDKRITEYERRNAAFQDDIKKPGHLAAAQMIPLIIMDIAFLKSFDGSGRPRMLRRTGDWRGGGV